MKMAGRRKPWAFDWGLKLLSVAIALLLWSSYRSEPTVEMTYQAPLEFRNVPRDLELAGDFPPTVRVRVRGRSAVLRQATAGDFAVIVDLREARPGASVMHLSAGLIDPPLGTQIVRITPELIGLRLDTREGPR